MLSNHHYPPDELYGFGSRIKSGEQIPYDPINLACCAESLADQEYFEAHFDWKGETLPCRRCGKAFKPELDEVLCPRCSLETKEALLICEQCIKIFEGDARYCQQCGTVLTAGSELSSGSIGSGLAIACRRGFATRDIIGKSQFMAEIYDAESSEVRRGIYFELETFALYVSTIAVREVTPCAGLGVRIIRAMLELYEKGWVLAGSDPAVAREFGTRRLRRFDEYDRVAIAHPDKPEFWMATEAARNCFGTDKHLGATMEMMVVLGYFLRAFREFLKSTTSR